MEKRITIQEKCLGIKKVKNFQGNVDQIRLELCLKENNFTEESSKLELSNFEFSSISSLKQYKFPKLTHLNISKNTLTSLEIDSFINLPQLIHLDISYNSLPSLKIILDCVSKLKDLSTLSIVHSTKGKETAVPREYAFQLFKVLKQLQSCDGINNPFGSKSSRHKPRKQPTQMTISETLLQPPDISELRVSVETINMENLSSIYKQQNEKSDDQDVPKVPKNWAELYKPTPSMFFGASAPPMDDDD